MALFKSRPNRDRGDDPEEDPAATLSAEDIEKVKSAFRVDFGANPPRIGVIGISGTGKSSVINRMFRTNLLVSHTRAGTKGFLATPMSVRILKGPAKDEPINLVVVDAPGLGEDVRKDPGYLDQYNQHLPPCDVILWLTAARNRAVSLDQQYLARLKPFHDRIIFGVSQVDLVHPMDWNTRINLPSVAMEENITDIIADRTQKFADVIGRRPELIPLSASHGYNLEALFNAMISSAPQTRRFVFDLLKNFSYTDFIPAELRGMAR
ncbi:MAG TPA: GTPase [Micromonosporaceae bacterium]|jgi:hypothetical protein